MSEAITLGGEFWVPAVPDVPVRGEYSAEPGKQPEVSLVADLVDDPRVRPNGSGVTFASSPAEMVKAFLPITLQGQLETGECVTLLNAQNHGGGFFRPPRYVAHGAVLGDAHVTGEDQLYSAVRFRLGNPYWLGHLTAGEPTVLDDDGSTLSVERSEDGNWLVYSSSAPATLRQLEIRVVSGCQVLAQLVLHQDLAIRQTELRVASDDPWLSVHGPGVSAPPDDFDPRTLLRREELTVERFAKWITLNDTLDGLAWAVARPIKAELQVQVLMVTSLLEGLHRRLPFEQSKFPDASPSALDRIKQAARRAGRDKAEAEPGLDPQKVHGAVKNAVSHFGDVDYLQRAADVVNKVCSVVPEIAESVADLPGRLLRARNEMAHHLPQDEEKEPLEVRYLRWLVIATVTPWLLRGLLLLRAGIEPLVLHDGYLQHGRFAYFRANTAQHVRELGWEFPSST